MPAHLAERILRDRASVEGERRTITVLFADAVGSTPLAERLGEEEMYLLMQDCVGRMAQVIHAYEGHVASFTGDGLMAVFGAPIAREESERRAVGAALEMQRSLEEYAQDIKRRQGVECRFRVGLNTGPVVVGKVHDDLHMEFTAVGDTVNLAARMEQLADPGSVYLSEYTWRAVRDFVECEPLGAVVAKGKAEPITAYRALRELSARTRLEVSAERGLVPFVGRQRELDFLHRHLEEARQGRGQVVFVSGEAGMGKSRLLLEFRRSLGENVKWLEGHCISYGRNIAYHPIVEIVKRAFGIQDNDAEAGMIERVDQAIADWLHTSQALVAYLKYLLAVDPGDPAVVAMDPRERRAGIFDALRALLREQSSDETVVVVVEDLHWVDDLSEEALAALLDVVPQCGVLLVLTSRADQSPSLAERAPFNGVDLGHLSDAAGQAVARSVLGVDALPSEVEALIAGKGEGNPFFIEEVTKSLVEIGVLARSNGTYVPTRPLGDVRIPGTIQEVILARIDRLEGQAKSAIQLASVIGREFTARLLDRISDRQVRTEHALGELQALELIYETTRFPELAFMFKHALTHDVAYSTLLGRRRKALHRAVGAAIEELYSDRLAEHYETLAHHFSAGEDWDKALLYLSRAADKAVAAYSNQQALEFYDRALQVCDELGSPALATATVLLRKKGLVDFGTGRYAAALSDFDRLLTTAGQLEDRSLVGMALAYRGFVEVWDHNFEQAEATLRAALVVADEGFDEVRAQASLMLASLFTIIGRLPEARPFLAVVREMESKLDPVGAATWGYFTGRFATWEGRYEESLARFEQWRPAVERVMTYRLLHDWGVAAALIAKGDYEVALRQLEELLATCDRVGDGVARMRMFNLVGWLHAELQGHERALDWNLQGVEASRSTGIPNPEVEMQSLLNIAENLLALGRTAEAERYLKDVEAVVRHPDQQQRFMHWRYSQRYFLDHGQLHLDRGDPARAIACVEEGLAMAEETDSRKHVAMARRLKGRALQLQGQLHAAEAELTAALRLAEEVGNPPQIWKSHVALGDLHCADGNPDAARHAYRNALTIIDQVAASLTDESLRDTFLTSTHVQGIRETAASLR